VTLAAAALAAAPSESPSSASGARAAATVGIDELEALVAKLGAPEWEEREQATEAIIALSGSDVNERLKARLEREDLDPEQRHRLVDALCRRITERPRGAIGITMDTMRRDGRGVRVSDLVRGMPAMEVLRVGDVIERINEIPVRTSEELAAVVQEMTPGTPVRLRVQRPVRDDQGRPRRDALGEAISTPIELTMQLGSMEQLEQRERFGMNSVRVQTQVQREREREAALHRARFGGPSQVVRVAGVEAQRMGTTFAGLLEFVERSLDESETDESVSLGRLEEALRGIELLKARLGDPSVTDQDRERLAITMRRAALLFSRAADTMP